MYPICRRRPIHAAVLPILSLSLLASLPQARAEPSDQASYDKAFPTLPESGWVGLRMMVLPQSKALQHYGYQELYRPADETYQPMHYADYAGRTFRIVQIEKGYTPDGAALDEASLRFEDNKEVLQGDIDHGCMDDVAPAADLEEARQRYLGKTLWLASDHLTAYDPEKDISDAPDSPDRHAAFQRIAVKQFEPAKVLNIVPGWYASVPTRFIVQEQNGDSTVEGYVDVHMSNTNVPANLWGVGRFQDTFLESDPRKTFAWPLAVWAAIENKEVIAGMTAQQVRMSWGEPKQITAISSPASAERWMYDPTHVLTLENGVLNSVSSQPVPIRQSPPPIRVLQRLGCCKEPSAEAFQVCQCRAGLFQSAKSLRD